MKLSTRYGLTGICALAALSIVHWLRESDFQRDVLYAYILGVSPNLFAAIAITFVVLSIWADQQKSIEYRVARRWFLIAATIAGVGLLGWEAAQRAMDSFVFDIHDIGATLVGVLLSTAFFHLLTPPTAPRPAP